MNELIKQFKSEWNSKKYISYCDCPSYLELKIKLDNINKLNIKNGWRINTIEEILEYRD